MSSSSSVSNIKVASDTGLGMCERLPNRDCVVSFWVISRVEKVSVKAPSIVNVMRYTREILYVGNVIVATVMWWTICMMCKSEGEGVYV